MASLRVPTFRRNWPLITMNVRTQTKSMPPLPNQTSEFQFTVDFGKHLNNQGNVYHSTSFHQHLLFTQVMIQKHRFRRALSFFLVYMDKTYRSKCTSMPRGNMASLSNEVEGRLQRARSTIGLSVALSGCVLSICYNHSLTC